MPRMTPTARGQEAEALFLALAVRKGWQVATSPWNTEAWDALIRRGDGQEWERVQVKRAYPKGGSLVANLRRHRSLYTENDIDIFGVVDVENLRVWIIPLEDLPNCGRKSMRGMDKYLIS